MQNLFYGWLDTIIIPQIPAKEKEKTQRNIKKRGGHLWASTFQIVKKSPVQPTCADGQDTYREI